MGIPSKGLLEVGCVDRLFLWGFGGVNLPFRCLQD